MSRSSSPIESFEPLTEGGAAGDSERSGIAGDTERLPDAASLNPPKPSLPGVRAASSCTLGVPESMPECIGTMALSFDAFGLGLARLRRGWTFNSTSNKSLPSAGLSTSCGGRGVPDPLESATLPTPGLASLRGAVLATSSAALEGADLDREVDGFLGSSSIMSPKSSSIDPFEPLTEGGTAGDSERLPDAASYASWNPPIPRLDWIVF
mmetsp:Transcript_53633/g.85273  ORF Transcript_53633/g.85273 Transcript_53633/m.85273 type:complete len:209 (+) Transcript_53633:2561-3187(+)